MIIYQEPPVSVRIDDTGITAHNGRADAVVVMFSVLRSQLFCLVIAAAETVHLQRYMDEEMQKSIVITIETREMAQARAPLCRLCYEKMVVDRWPLPGTYRCPTCAENETDLADIDDLDDCEDETDWED